MRSTSIKAFSGTVIGILAILMCSCTQPQNETTLTELFPKLEKHVYNGNKDSVQFYVKQITPLLSRESVFFPRFYLLRGLYEFGDFDKVRTYGDSAMLFFKSESNINKYPDLYASVLMMKGENAFYNKMGGESLEYYFKALNYQRLNLDNKEAGSIYYKIGGVYFVQLRFDEAIKYYLEYRNILQQLKNKDIVYFYKMQATLNNIGVAYERQKKYDSAFFYYRADLTHINSFKDSSRAFGNLYTASQLVVLDNIGGLLLKQGKTDSAMKVINQALALPYAISDGARFTTFLKQAKIASALNNVALQKTALDSVEGIYSILVPGAVKLMGEQIADYLHAKSEYYARIGNLKKAYDYRTAYNDKKDSLAESNFWIYHLNFQTALSNYRQIEQIQQLEFKNRVRSYLLYSAAIVAILFSVILLLNRRQLKKSKLLQKLTKAHNKELKSALRELEITNKRQLRMMRVMAHDLKNPVAGIAGLADIMLEDKNNTADINEMLELMRKTSNNASNMINELLTSALNEDAVLEKENANIARLIQDAVEVIRLKATEKKQKIEWHSSHPIVMAEVNTQSIYRAVSNLIVNAIKFSAPGKSIEVNLENFPDENRILISVKDEGIGISDEEKDEVFQMFSGAKKPGTAGEIPFGLGLSITKKIVERHFGSIWFTSSVGVGTTFYIELPIELKKLKNYTGFQFPVID